MSELTRREALLLLAGLAAAGPAYYPTDTVVLPDDGCDLCNCCCPHQPTAFTISLVAVTPGEPCILDEPNFPAGAHEG